MVVTLFAGLESSKFARVYLGIWSQRNMQINIDITTGLRQIGDIIKPMSTFVQIYISVTAVWQ